MRGQGPEHRGRPGTFINEFRGASDTDIKARPEVSELGSRNATLWIFAGLIAGAIAVAAGAVVAFPEQAGALYESVFGAPFGGAEEASTTGTTGDDTGTTGDTETDGDPIDVDVVPAPGGIRRLTPSQYVQSVELMLGAAAAEAADPPPLPQLGSFDSETAVGEPLTPIDIEAYEGSALDIGTAVMNDSSGLAVVAPCINLSHDAACYQQIAENLGRFAWRRPL
ncbi:MAG: hypothetical protein KC636_04975, partial [Myxococcales bacterium]|nr:hypothetical protein [Myxococcales bacterium]